MIPQKILISAHPFIQLLASPFFRRGIEGVANQQHNPLSPPLRKGDEKEKTINEWILIHLKIIFIITTLFISSVSLAQDISTLQKFLSPFSETKNIKLTYQEKRSSIFFKQPQVYTGYIKYIFPDTFIKQVNSPHKKKIVIIKEKLTIYDYESVSHTEASHKKTVEINDYPQFKQIKALFSALFKGQASELIKYYHYEIKTLMAKKSQLILKPLVDNPFIDEELKKNRINKQINIFFENEHISKITMIGLSGEQSEISFDKK